MCRNSAESSIKSTAAKFSSRRWSFVVPGIGRSTASGTQLTQRDLRGRRVLARDFLQQVDEDPWPDASGEERHDVAEVALGERRLGAPSFR
jgi:hypothetical protein